MEPITALTALLPFIGEALKAAIQRWIAPDTFKPTNAADYIAIREQDIKLFQAMNAVGAAPSYPWVEAIIKLQRPVVCGFILLTWVYVTIDPLATEKALVIVNNLAGAVTFYLFGDRTLFYAKKVADK